MGFLRRVEGGVERMTQANFARVRWKQLLRDNVPRYNPKPAHGNAKQID
jgi:hypothetical protein